ncbi:MAG: BrnT family toxin [Acidobacteriaceae bacterium]|nr:BrnT family toxin [Acidobacteriaceae bacterium]
MKFEWDEAKASSNLKKHGVAFNIAARVFCDLRRIEEKDVGDYGNEARWKTVGLIDTQEIVVIYTELEDRLRIISARRAETHERKEYWQNRNV